MTVKVRCNRCTAIAEGDTFEKAAELVDHSLGLSKGRKCPGGPRAPLVITGETKSEQPKPKQPEIKKASIQQSQTKKVTRK